MREKDDTMLVDMDEEDQLELNLELERDELSSYFQKAYEPKVLITFSDNPHQVNFLLYCFLSSPLSPSQL
jgi:ribosome production factor 1